MLDMKLVNGKFKLTEITGDDCEYKITDLFISEMYKNIGRIREHCPDATIIIKSTTPNMLLKQATIRPKDDFAIEI